MAVPLLSSPGDENFYHPLFSESSQKSNHSCLPGFYQNSMFTLPLSEPFISGMHLSFKIPTNFKGFWGGIPPFLPRRVLPGLFFLPTTPRRVIAQLHSSSWFMATQSRKLHINSSFSDYFHTLLPGNSATLRRHTFLQPRGSWDHALVPGILPPQHL